jgi:hypothetical protein
MCDSFFGGGGTTGDGTFATEADVAEYFWMWMEMEVLARRD